MLARLGSSGSRLRALPGLDQPAQPTSRRLAGDEEDRCRQDEAAHRECSGRPSGQSSARGGRSERSQRAQEAPYSGCRAHRRRSRQAGRRSVMESRGAPNRTRSVKPMRERRVA